MRGKLKRLDRKKGYGFIYSDGNDYFFHRDSFDGHWGDICDDYDAQKDISLEFESSKSKKGNGLRAENVRIV